VIELTKKERKCVFYTDICEYQHLCSCIVFMRNLFSDLFCGSKRADLKFLCFIEFTWKEWLSILWGSWIALVFVFVRTENKLHDFYKWCKR